MEVDAEAIETLLPKLEQAEEASRKKEESLKEIEKEKQKMGAPEDMTVCLLKEVLDSLNITYISNEKKAELIAKVHQARENLQEDETRSHQHALERNSVANLQAT